MDTVMPFSTVLRLAWQNYYQRFDLILLVNCLIALPLYVLIDWMTPRDLLNQPIDNLQSLLQLVMQPRYIQYLVVQGLANLVMVFISIAIIVYLKYTYLKISKTIPTILQDSAKLFPVALGLTIIITILTFIGYSLFIVPGIIISLMLAFALPVLIWKNLSVGKALIYSWSLVKKHWWLVLTYLLLVELMVSVGSALVVLALPDMFGFTAFGLTVASIFHSFIIVFTTILFTILDSQSVKPVHS